MAEHAEWKTEALWKILSRYDQYIATTNFKASVVAAVVSIAITGSIIARTEVLANTVSTVLAAIGVILLTLSLLCAIFAIIPNLFRGAPFSERSIIFFSDVVGRTGTTELQDEWMTLSEDDFSEDLIKQVNVVATITHKKFVRLKWSYGLLFFGFSAFVTAIVAAAFIGD